MGTTSQKLQYLTTTKGKIKDAINLTNANILSEDTFRSYAEKLKLGLIDIINNGTSDLYDSFPKTTQTGTEIALNDTYEAPMEIGLNGNTEQDGEPTPDVPVDVKVVKGNNTIVVTGKNLANPTLLFGNSNFYIINSNKEISTITNDNRAWTNLDGTNWGIGLKAGTYTISFNSISSGNIQIQGLSSGQIIRESLSTGSRTFTLTQDDIIGVKFLNLSSYPYNAGHIQIEQGSTASDYEEYQGKDYEINLGNIELCKIGDYQDYIYKENNKWYKHSEIQKTVITEDNKNIINSLLTQNEHERILINKDSLGWESSWDINVALINKYKEITLSSAVNSGTFGTNFTRGALTIWNDDFTDLATARNLLIGTEIYIAKATPTNTEITDTTLINQLEELEKAKSVDDKTFISQINEQLPFILDVSALSKN